MKEDMKGKVTYGIWGLILGACILWGYGFGIGGWTTGTSAQAMLNKAVSDTKAKTYASICAAQFMADPKSQENLAALKKLENGDRFEFIKKGGWDKIPGQTETISGVDQQCSYALEDFMNK